MYLVYASYLTDQYQCYFSVHSLTEVFNSEKQQMEFNKNNRISKNCYLNMCLHTQSYSQYSLWNRIIIHLGGFIAIVVTI